MAELTGKRERARAPLVEVLIGAVCAGGGRLSRARREFERMDARAGLERLLLQAVDPELLAAVVGPRLVPVWVEPLRAQYVVYKQGYPADWVDVEKVWRAQRVRWRRAAGTSASVSGAAGSQTLSRGYPERDSHASRGGAPRRSRTPAPAPPAPVVSRVHRPVPAGVAAVDDPEVEPVAAPPDAVASGVVAVEVVDAAAQQSRKRDDASKSVRVRRPAASGSSAASGSVSGGGVNGERPGQPLAPPPVRSEGLAPSDDARIVLSGKAGALIERLLRAMADSRARVDSVRRVWIDADGLAGGWDLWALDAAVIARVRQLSRGMER